MPSAAMHRARIDLSGTASSVPRLSVTRSVGNDPRRVHVASRAFVRNDACLSQANPISSGLYSTSSFSLSGSPNLQPSELVNDSYLTDDLQEETNNMEFMFQSDLIPFNPPNTDDSSIMMDNIASFDHLDSSPDVSSSCLDDEPMSAAGESGVEYFSPGFSGDEDNEVMIDLSAVALPSIDNDVGEKQDFLDEKDISQTEDGAALFDHAISTLTTNDSVFIDELLEMVSASVENEVLAPATEGSTAALPKEEEEVVVMTEEQFFGLHSDTDMSTCQVVTLDFLGQAVAEAGLQVQDHERGPNQVQQQSTDSTSTVNTEQWRALLAERTISYLSDSAAGSTFSMSPPRSSLSFSSAYSPSDSSSSGDDFSSAVESPVSTFAATSTGAAPSGSGRAQKKAQAKKMSQRKSNQARKKKTSPVDRQQRKREQNKEAAYRYRLKKKEVEELNLGKLTELENNNKILRKQLKKLRDMVEGAKALARSAL